LRENVESAVPWSHPLVLPRLKKGIFACTSVAGHGDSGSMGGVLRKGKRWMGRISSPPVEYPSLFLPSTFTVILHKGNQIAVMQCLQLYLEDSARAWLRGLPSDPRKIWSTLSSRTFRPRTRGRSEPKNYVTVSRSRRNQCARTSGVLLSS
jgi:hypothetical protein